MSKRAGHAGKVAVSSDMGQNVIVQIMRHNLTSTNISRNTEYMEGYKHMIV